MMKLDYMVPFKAQTGQDAQLAIKEGLINIEGVAIDTSTNSNKWQVPPEDLDFFVQSLQGAQLRVDHAESALAVIGRVPEASRVGQEVHFRAEIGDATIIQKVLRGYLTHVSVQVDSDNVECSKCHQQTRKEGILVHLCPGAWEIVHKPRVRELSIVASPAYKHTEFKPVGFAAAMDRSQWQSSTDPYADVVNRMQHCVDMIEQMKQSDLESKIDIAERIQKLSSKLQKLKSEDATARRENLKMRIADLQEKVAKMAEEEAASTIEAEFKTPLKIHQEFLNAIKKFNMQKNSHTAMQLEKLMQHQQLVERFGDYFSDSENFERLKRLVYS